MYRPWMQCPSSKIAFLYQISHLHTFYSTANRSALFVDSLSTDPLRIRRQSSCFSAGRGCEIQYSTGIGHFLAALGPVPTLTAFGRDFSIGSQRCLANYSFTAN